MTTAVIIWGNNPPQAIQHNRKGINFSKFTLTPKPNRDNGERELQTEQTHIL